MNNVNWGVKFFKKAMFYVKVMTRMSLFETLYQSNLTLINCKEEVQYSAKRQSSMSQSVFYVPR